jgi:hypothetical protein
MAKSEKTTGVSLAKGPVGVIGLVLVAYGVTALIFGGQSFAQHAPNGVVHGKTWLGVEVNGWSGVLFIAAGLLLMLAARRHWGAKGMSLIVGLALGAGALIGLAKGHGVLGIFAANHLTELVWGAAAVLLIASSQLPRVGRNANQRDVHVRARRPGATRGADRDPAPVTHQHRESTGEADGQMPSTNGSPSAQRVAPTVTVPGRDDTAAGSDGATGTVREDSGIAGHRRLSDSTSPAVRAPSDRGALTATSPTHQPDEHRSKSNG